MNRIAIALFVLVASIASADMKSMQDRLDTLIRLKDEGKIGEKLDGMVGAIGSDAESAKVVADENRDRLQLFQERAKDVPLPEYLRAMGDAKVSKEPKGRFVQDASGGWKKK